MSEPVYGWRALFLGYTNQHDDFFVMGSFGTRWTEPRLKAQCRFDMPVFAPSHPDEYREHLAYLHLSGERPCPNQNECGIYLLRSPRAVVGKAMAINLEPFGWYFYYLMCYTRGEGVIGEYQHGWRAQLATVELILASPHYDWDPKFPETDPEWPTFEEATDALLSWAKDVPVYLVPCWRRYTGDERIGNVLYGPPDLEQLTSTQNWLGIVPEFKLRRLVERLERAGFLVDGDCRLRAAESLPSPGDARRQS
jgi:hypothetical protein